jgi:hypothetical protein
MRRTPDSVSRARQKVRKELERWGARIKTERHKPKPDPEGLAFGEGEIALCNKEMRKLNKISKKQFWHDE